jgi:L-arabinose transport system substrate-binding protein
MTPSKISGGIAAAALLVGFAGAARADDVKLGYINKMGDHPWFVAEVAGAKAEAAKDGAKISTQDVQFNADLTLTTLDAMIGDGVQGVAIVVPLWKTTSRDPATRPFPISE